MIDSCEFEQLIEKCNGLLERDSGNALALAIRAFAYAQIPEQEKAGTDSLKAISLAPDNADVLTMRAAVLGIQFRIPESIKVLKRALEIDPDHLYANCFLAHAYYFSGEYPLGRELMDPIIASKPDAAFAWFVHANLERACFRLGVSRAAHEKAAELNPKFIKVILMLGYDQLELTPPNIERAMEFAEQAIKSSPECHFGYSFRAYVRVFEADKSQLEAALEDLKRASGLAPDHYDPWFIKSDCLQVFERWEDSLSALDEALTRHPRHPYILLGRARPLAMLGRINESMDACDAAEELFPNHYRPGLVRGFTYIMDDQPGEGWLELDDAEKKFDGNPYLHYWKTWCHESASPAQLLEINRAIEILPDNGSFFHRRGEIHEQLGQEEKAKADYAKAKELGYERPGKEGDA